MRTARECSRIVRVAIREKERYCLLIRVYYVQYPWTIYATAYVHREKCWPFKFSIRQLHAWHSWWLTWPYDIPSSPLFVLALRMQPKNRVCSCEHWLWLLGIQLHYCLPRYSFDKLLHGCTKFLSISVRPVPHNPDTYLREFIPVWGYSVNLSTSIRAKYHCVRW